MRYPPIPENEWTDEQRKVARAIMAGPRGVVRGPFVPLMHAPALAAKVQEVGDVVRFQTDFPNALVEIAVCMTARARNCPYIWVSHSRAAARAGVAPSLLAAIAAGQRPTAMNTNETLVYDYCNGLLNAAEVTDAVFAAVEKRWGKKGAMELAGICGYYAMLACVVIAAQHPLPPDAVPFAVP